MLIINSKKKIHLPFIVFFSIFLLAQVGQRKGNEQFQTSGQGELRLSSTNKITLGFFLQVVVSSKISFSKTKKAWRKTVQWLHRKENRRKWPSYLQSGLIFEMKISSKWEARNKFLITPILIQSIVLLQLCNNLTNQIIDVVSNFYKQENFKKSYSELKSQKYLIWPWRSQVGEALGKYIWIGPLKNILVPASIINLHQKNILIRKITRALFYLTHLTF